MFGLASLAVAALAAGSAPPACGRTSGSAPKLSASFYNLWASQLDWSVEQWTEDLTWSAALSRVRQRRSGRRAFSNRYMKAVGIEWAFVTYTSCLDTKVYTAYCWSGGGNTNKTEALYNSSNPQYVQVGHDVLGKFLAAASALEIKVLVGLQLIEMHDFGSTALLYQDLATDLHRGYGHSPAFKGFYLTQEWGPVSYREQADEVGAEFLGPISDHIHGLDPSYEVGLSPSLSDVTTWGPCPAAWYTDLGDYLGHCGGAPTPTLRIADTPQQWAQWWTTALGHAPHFTWLFVQVRPPRNHPVPPCNHPVTTL